MARGEHAVILLVEDSADDALKVRRALDAAGVRNPFLVVRSGEEAREYEGDLPFKLALFDSKIAWVPLETNAPRHPVVSVLIRHPALGKALRLLFDYLWKGSEPIKFGAKGVRKGSGAAKVKPSRK